MSAFGGDALQRKEMSHKSSFIIIDDMFQVLFSNFIAGKMLQATKIFVYE